MLTRTPCTGQSRPTWSTGLMMMAMTSLLHLMIATAKVMLGIPQAPVEAAMAAAVRVLAAAAMRALQVQVGHQNPAPAPQELEVLVVTVAMETPASRHGGCW